MLSSGWAEGLFADMNPLRTDCAMIRKLILRVAVVSFPAGLLFAPSGCSKKPDTLTDQYDEAEMDAAIQKARETFGQFKQRLAHPKPGDSGFAVKVKISDGNDTEHFWLIDIKVNGDSFSGVINNEPGTVKKVKLGQTYKFTFDDVSDWLYMSNGVMQGNHTLRVMLKSMPPEKAEAMKKKFGWQ